MEKFVEFVRNLGPVKIGIIGAVTLSVLGLLLFATTSFKATNMVVLYTHIDPSVSSKIAARLTAEKIPFQILSDGTEILVPDTKVDGLRMQLAQKGLTGRIVGYELFDNENAYNSSSFLQRINEVRALEGEITRTITSIDGVLNARVNIVMPKRELFSRSTRKATASVLIRMEGGKRLSPDQIAGIQNLIASSVPNLSPDNISIVDQRGVLLARGGDSATLEESREVKMKLDYEDNVRAKLINLLTDTLGEGNVKVEVEANLDMTKTTVSQEQYDPNGRVLRSSEEIDQKSISRHEAPQPVTVSNNLPNAAAQLPQTNSGIINQNSRTEARSNYEISKTLTNSVLQVGRLKNISVAVLVNGTFETQNGKQVYVPRSPEEIAKITELIKSAIGYDSKRGDQVKVVNMKFTSNEFDQPQEEKTYFGFPVSDIRWLIKTVILSILAILILLLLVRPMMKKFIIADDEEAKGLLTAQPLDEFGNPVPLGPDGKPIDEEAMIESVTGDTSAADEEIEHMINIKNIEGRIKASSLQKITEIIDKHPQEAVGIIRGWLLQDSNN